MFRHQPTRRESSTRKTGAYATPTRVEASCAAGARPRRVHDSRAADRPRSCDPFAVACALYDRPGSALDGSNHQRNKQRATRLLPPLTGRAHFTSGRAAGAQRAGRPGSRPRHGSRRSHGGERDRRPRAAAGRLRQPAGGRPGPDRPDGDRGALGDRGGQSRGQAAARRWGDLHQSRAAADGGTDPAARRRGSRSRACGDRRRPDRAPGPGQRPPPPARHGRRWGARSQRPDPRSRRCHGSAPLDVHRSSARRRR